MKKPLQFWEDLYVKLRSAFFDANQIFRVLHMQHKAYYYVRLKSMYGMNQEYTGNKLFNRRDEWLKERAIRVTQIASAYQEACKLHRRMEYANARIQALGAAAKKLPSKLKPWKLSKVQFKRRPRRVDRLAFHRKKIEYYRQMKVDGVLKAQNEKLKPTL